MWTRALFSAAGGTVRHSSLELELSGFVRPSADLSAWDRSGIREKTSEVSDILWPSVIPEVSDILGASVVSDVTVELKSFI